MQFTSRIPQHRGEMLSSRRSLASVHLQMFLMAIVFSCIPSSQSFNMKMEYKPPVKSSVGKLHDRRLSRDLSSRHEDSSPSRSSSSSSKSASATGISYYEPASALPPTSDDSFERRMRDMVLGNQKQREGARSATALPTRKFARKLPPTQLPPNVHVIETLQGYKAMVADETESVVAVRFYAPWCKVSIHLVAQQFYFVVGLVQPLSENVQITILIAFCFIFSQHTRHVELLLLCFITWRQNTQTWCLWMFP
jgi:hypothetical protein